MGIRPYGFGGMVQRKTRKHSRPACAAGGKGSLNDRTLTGRRPARIKSLADGGSSPPPAPTSDKPGFGTCPGIPTSFLSLDTDGTRHEPDGRGSSPGRSSSDRAPSSNRKDPWRAWEHRFESGRRRVGDPCARLRKPGRCANGFPSTVLRVSSLSPPKHASMGTPEKGNRKE